jgi:hypothetical protein
LELPEEEQSKLFAKKARKSRANKEEKAAQAAQATQDLASQLVRILILSPGLITSSIDGKLFGLSQQHQNSPK